MSPLALIIGVVVIILSGLFVLAIVIGGNGRQVSDDYNEMEELDYAPSNGESFWREE